MHFRENWLIFWGIRGELILGILGVYAKYFQGADDFLGIWENQCFILGSTDLGA